MAKIIVNKTECAETQAEFQERMKAQCKQIEQYRLTVMHNEGRCLSEDEAALEWISCYAKDFALDMETA